MIKKPFSSINKPTKEPVIERIFKLAERYKSRREAAKAWGINENTLKNYYKRKDSNPTPRQNQLIKIAESEGVSLEWLLMGGELESPNTTNPMKNRVDGADLIFILDEAHSNSPEIELINLIRVLDKNEIYQLVTTLKRKGVELLTLLNDDISLELLQLPEHEKIQLLTRYKNIKEGAFEGDQEDVVTHPTQNQVG